MLEEGDTSSKIAHSQDESIVHVKVPAGSSSIIIMRRTDRCASYQVTYYSAVVFPEEAYLKAIQTIVRSQPEKELKRIKE